MVPLALALLVGSYLLGAIPFGVVFARAKGVDLRAVGSGNIGATNAARALGKRIGLLVFACDAAKGAVPILVARHLVAGDPNAESIVAGAGAAAFVGHIASPFLRFRGGKGVATAFGVFAALAWPAALLALFLFATLYAITRVSSIGSLVAATVFVPALLVLHAGRPALALAGFMWLLIVIRHHGNIRRLLRREEPPV